MWLKKRTNYSHLFSMIWIYNRGFPVLLRYALHKKFESAFFFLNCTVLGRSKKSCNQLQRQSGLPLNAILSCSWNYKEQQEVMERIIMLMVEDGQEEEFGAAGSNINRCFSSSYEETQLGFRSGDQRGREERPRWSKTDVGASCWMLHTKKSSRTEWEWASIYVFEPTQVSS